MEPNDNDTTPPSLGPERKGHTPVDDPGSVHGETLKHHLDDLSTTLNAQEQRIEDTITDVIGKANDRAHSKKWKH